MGGSSSYPYKRRKAYAVVLEGVPGGWLCKAWVQGHEEVIVDIGAHQIEGIPERGSLLSLPARRDTERWSLRPSTRPLSPTQRKKSERRARARAEAFLALVKP